MAYTAYTRASTYWTLRKRGSWYLVLLLRSGTYEEVDRCGSYRRAGAAATAVGALTYRAALVETTELIREGLQSRLDEMSLGAVPPPDRPASEAPVEVDLEDTEQAE